MFAKPSPNHIQKCMFPLVPTICYVTDLKDGLKYIRKAVLGSVFLFKAS